MHPITVKISRCLCFVWLVVMLAIVAIITTDLGPRPLAQQFMDRAICRYLHLGLPLRQAGSSCSHEGGCGKKRGDDRVKVQSLISPLALWRGQRAAPPRDINEPDVQSTSQEVCNKPSPHMPSSLKRSSSRRIIFKVSASKKITSVIDSLRVRAIATPPRH
jgi:hypothetical protein